MQLSLIIQNLELSRASVGLEVRMTAMTVTADGIKVSWT
jgi:hypothetical protein